MHLEGWIHSVHFGGIDTHVNFRRMDTECGGMNTQCGFRGLDITQYGRTVYIRNAMVVQHYIRKFTFSICLQGFSLKL